MVDGSVALTCIAPRLAVLPLHLRRSVALRLSPSVTLRLAPNSKAFFSDFPSPTTYPPLYVCPTIVTRTIHQPMPRCCHEVLRFTHSIDQHAFLSLATNQTILGTVGSLIIPLFLPFPLTICRSSPAHYFIGSTATSPCMW